MRTLVTFDVSSNKARRQVVKVLKGYAQRVQKSVFEVQDIEQAAYLHMRSRIEKHVDPATDSVRYYTLCASCVPRIEHFGAAPGLLEDDDDATVV